MLLEEMFGVTSQRGQKNPKQTFQSTVRLMQTACGGEALELRLELLKMGDK